VQPQKRRLRPCPVVVSLSPSPSRPTIGQHKIPVLHHHIVSLLERDESALRRASVPKNALRRVLEEAHEARGVIAAAARRPLLHNNQPAEDLDLCRRQVLGVVHDHRAKVFSRARGKPRLPASASAAAAATLLIV
jgi:hypothetical protein